MQLVAAEYGLGDLVGCTQGGRRYTGRVTAIHHQADATGDRRFARTTYDVRPDGSKLAYHVAESQLWLMERAPVSAHRDPEMPAWANSGIVTQTTIRFGLGAWRERLRVLLGRPIHVTTAEWTEGMIGRHEADTRRVDCFVERVRWPWQREKPLCMVGQQEPIGLFSTDLSDVAAAESPEPESDEARRIPSDLLDGGPGITPGDVYALPAGTYRDDAELERAIAEVPKIETGSRFGMVE